jgi:hypothetical protein
MIGIKTHNFSGDVHWLREIKITSIPLVSIEILNMRLLQFIDIDIATENILMS